jgi:hypothetical protein
MNIAIINTTIAMPMMSRGFLPVPDHSPLTAPQKLALKIPIEERMGQPTTAASSPILELPTP